MKQGLEGVPELPVVSSNGHPEAPTPRVGLLTRIWRAYWKAVRDPVSHETRKDYGMGYEP